MNKLIHQAALFCRRNAPTILTYVGGVGVVATSVMAVKATPKALSILEEAKKEKEEELTKLEVVKAVWPVYIPAIVTGVGTLMCVFGANVLNKHAQASLASAYALVERSYSEYKNKVQELYGDEAHEKIVQEIAKDKYEEAVVKVDDDKQLFFDEFSGRYFESTLADVRDAEYRLNRELNMRGYAYLNDWYEFLGMEPVDSGELYGWTPDGNIELSWQTWLDFKHTKTLINDDLECYIITMFQEPYLNFEDY